jgi:hypothetical protein
VLALSGSTGVYAEDEATVRLYRTREEEREVGLKRQLTRWLTSSGLAEVEWYRDELDIVDGGLDITRELEANFQLGLVATASDAFKAEVLIEFDTIRQDLELDEGLLSFETGPWEVEVGRLYLPFGVYYSRFVSSPILELGELRAYAATASYGYRELFDAALGVYRGREREQGGGSGTFDWALAMDFFPTESLSLGWSYVTDLADSDARLLEDVEDLSIEKSPGISAYISRLGKRLDLSAEIVAATRPLDGLEPDRNQPVAWNLELAHLIGRRYEVAFRLEGSRELEDEPERRIGVAGTVRLGKRASLTAEYLRGWYSPDMASTDDDEPFDRADFLAARASVAF